MSQINEENIYDRLRREQAEKKEQEKPKGKPVEERLHLERTTRSDDQKSVEEILNMRR